MGAEHHEGDPGRLSLVERILGCLPEEDLEDGERVREHLRAERLLPVDERFVAGIDESWRANARRGVVLTDRRILRYRRDRVREIALLPEVQAVRVRRMWYPGAVGRGEVFGKGPVVVLRMRLRLAGGRTARLRLQDFAGTLRPFVAALVERLPGRVEVARTLPGL